MTTKVKISESDLVTLLEITAEAMSLRNRANLIRYAGGDCTVIREQSDDLVRQVNDRLAAAGAHATFGIN